MTTFDITLGEYLHDIDEVHLLDAEEETLLARRIIDHNDPEARERMIRSNLRLVVNIAKKYSKRGMALADLIEEGNLGLLRAIDTFDPSHGVRFGTYAAWWIKQSIKRSLQSSVATIHVPGYMMEMINQWRGAGGELEAKLGRAPSIEETAKHLQLPLRKAKIVDDMAQTVSGVQSDSLDDSHGLSDVIEDSRSGEAQEAMLNQEEMQKAVALLDVLEKREQQVLTMRFGLNGCEPVGLVEIGKALRLTRERVRQIQNKALEKLQEYMLS
ncbi:MAG: hypothetical protein A2Y07_01385 [Planctomycetes bacterium GWF2_50_10]|nr:MAG: hypothetical protein A2Y07_01385 [Planctomycetes bacterium GWF2_50_10]